MRIPLFFAIALSCFISGTPALSDDAYRAPRERMIREIRADAAYTSSAMGRDHLDERVMRMMSMVPRHEFVQTGMKHLAYRNAPLPIGHGQTISQPFIVALMTDLMNLEKNDVVLEIGTGSGYQAAVLSGLSDKVYTIEIIKILGESARLRLQRLGYDNVEVLIGDGYYGWKDKAPFDAIIVTCAAGHVPPPLVEQLKPGGRIIIPIGGVYTVQTLMVVTKDRSGDYRTERIIPVRFVPMTGRAQKAE